MSYPVMREKIKCLDGPMEGEEVYLDRRLFVLYDQKILEDNEGRYVYQITNDGLRFTKNA